MNNIIQSVPDPKDILDIIYQKNPKFASILEGELLQSLLQKATIENYLPNSLIIQQNDVSDSFYVILSGRCIILVNDQPLHQLEAGDIVGEMGIIQKIKRTASIKTIEETQALKVPDYVFYEMLKNPKLSEWVIDMLVERLKQSSQNAATVLKEMDEIKFDQMELARIQRSLLPETLPEDPRFDIQVLYSPCAYAGGDYYDCFKLDDNTLFMIIADVTGHGAQASITMAIVRSFIHQGDIGKSPSTILKNLNNYLFENGPSSHFVTAQVIIVDFDKMEIEYAYAGHPPLLHLRDSQCKPLTGPRSFFLKFRPDCDFESSTTKIKSGDRITFFTDGIIETSNHEGTMLNIKGLENFLQSTANQPIDVLPDELERYLEQFTNGNPIEDDLTFMILEIK